MQSQNGNFKKKLQQDLHILKIILSLWCMVKMRLINLLPFFGKHSLTLCEYKEGLFFK
jgi:hypothetical protein